MEEKNIQQLDAIVAEAAQTVAQKDYEVLSELEQKLMGCVVDMQADYPPNCFLFSIGGVPVITKGDIHTIGAKQKGGKTSLVAILLAAAAGNAWNDVACNTEELSALYIDTEMKKRDTQDLGNKVATMAGTDKLPERIHLVNFRPLTPQEMEAGIRFFIERLQPQFVVLDGVVDLCDNFNDVEASQQLVINFLMKLADEYNCAIVNVLHTNKTDGYTELRGHLGAFFEQKGVTVMKCDKDDNTNIVTVTCPTHRYAPVPAFHFTFDEDGIPISGEAQYQQFELERQRSKEEQKKVNKDKLFAERSDTLLNILKQHNGSMERKALVAAGINALKKGDSTIKDLIAAMKKEPHKLIEEKAGILSIINS